MNGKRIFCLILLIIFCAMSAAAENLVYNTEFAVDESGLHVDGWYGDSYIEENSLMYLDDEEQALYIISYDPNDARWMQDIEVKSGKTYRFSCYIKAKGITAAGRGANISILNTYVYSDSVYDTDGEWEYVEFYGTAGKKQSSVTLCLRLGGYSGDNTGEAWFKDIRAEQCDAPGDVTPVSMATFEPAEESPVQWKTGLPERNTQAWFLMGFLFLMAYFFLMKKGEELPCVKSAEKKKYTCGQLISLILLLLFAFALRLVIAAKVHGYHVDINCFTYWGDAMANKGFSFYAGGDFCDYPPLYMLALGVVGKIRQLTSITYGSVAHVVLIKLIPIFCDLGAAVLTYCLYRKKAGHGRALLLCCAIALSPAFIVDSAAWGQVDSVLTFLMALVVLFASRGSWQIALPVYAAAILTKPQALLFGPVGLIVCAVDFVCNKEVRRKALWGIAGAFAVLYVISLPFSINVMRWQGETSFAKILISPLGWLKDQLFGAANGYRYLTVNACNLFTLLNKNWLLLTNDALGIISWVMFASAYAYTAVLAVIGKKRENLALLGTLLMSLIFAFAPMMHERYLFPAIFLCVLAYIECRDRRLLVYLGVTSAAQFLNILLVLLWGMTEGFETSGHLQASEQTYNAILSVINCLNALFLAYVSFDIIVLGHRVGRRKAKKTSTDTDSGKTDYRLKLNRMDALLMAGVTLVYSVLAFTNLGNTKSPQNYWESTAPKEQVVFDLGEVTTYRFTFFGGISSARFTVALSDDGENWTDEYFAEFGDGMMYSWKWYVPNDYASGSFSKVYETFEESEGDGAKVTFANYKNEYPLQTSRYLRITAQSAGLILNEVGFIDITNDCLYEVKNVSGSKSGDYGALIDEQELVAFVPSYMNSMYFDEIYHARTGYELLHGYEAGKILEWSHPHLGKLLIALGIKLFGMTPFGWRFSGTLTGVIMLPVIYLLIKQLTGKSNLSFVGMCLMALDSMHFTQTRIATVDSYAVLFIMIMYLFMIRYYLMCRNNENLGRTLIPLGLSGLFMGFACSAKWTGIYAAAGLAVIFFLSVGERIVRYVKTERPLGENQHLVRDLIITCAFCVLFFIVIPVLIYYCSYYWHFRNSGGITIDKVWRLQQDMYGYHSTLVDDHWFKSPWYEWPLIVKPMWYYSADIDFTGRGYISSISCMGNPAVWWTGLVCLIVCTVLLVFRRKTDRRILLIVIGFLSQFLPWVLVPRSTFIYHYFASVPFIIIATVIAIDYLSKINRKFAFGTSIALLAAALVFFAMFYPLETGTICSYRYAIKYLRWFDWYNFALQ